jgi:hypothetical protein
LGCNGVRKKKQRKSNETIFHGDLQLKNLAILLWSTFWGLKQEEPLRERQAEFIVCDDNHSLCLTRWEISYKETMTIATAPAATMNYG